MEIRQSEWHKPHNKNVWRKTLAILELEARAVVIEIPGDMDPTLVSVREVGMGERG